MRIPTFFFFYLPQEGEKPKRVLRIAIVTVVDDNYGSYPFTMAYYLRNIEIESQVNLDLFLPFTRGL